MPTEEERDEAAEQQPAPIEQEAPEPPPLPRFVRYGGLVAAGIVRSWQQLNRMIDEQGFPPGVLLSANVRAWQVDQVTDWLKARPVERKAIPKTARRRPRKTKAA